MNVFFSWKHKHLIVRPSSCTTHTYERIIVNIAIVIFIKRKNIWSIIIVALHYMNTRYVFIYVDIV